MDSPVSHGSERAAGTWLWAPHCDSRDVTRKIIHPLQVACHCEQCQVPPDGARIVRRSAEKRLDQVPLEHLRPRGLREQCVSPHCVMCNEAFNGGSEPLSRSIRKRS